MGSCISTTTESLTPVAIVIGLDGSLTEHAIPATVYDILGSDHPSCFLCSSDGLLFDTHIPALVSGQLLEPNQIYFVLPTSKLGHPLTSAGMLALAVKASSAMTAVASNGRELHVSSVAEVPESVFEDGHVGMARSRPAAEKKMERSRSARPRKLSRVYSRPSLSAIDEVDGW